MLSIGLFFIIIDHIITLNRTENTKVNKNRPRMGRLKERNEIGNIESIKNFYTHFIVLFIAFYNGIVFNTHLGMTQVRIPII